MEIKTPLKIHPSAYHICRAWYNGSYTMATKPIKFLELHYTMTQFLIIPVTCIKKTEVPLKRSKTNTEVLMLLLPRKTHS